jgi:hypothetical protein
MVGWLILLKKELPMKKTTTKATKTTANGNPQPETQEVSPSFVELSKTHGSNRIDVRHAT